MYALFLKRILDLVIATIAFALLFPFFLIIAFILLITNNGKPFFFHPRPGKNGIIFKVIKFKSMNDKKDEHGQFLDFHLRVTKFGNFIRKYSLDEIPQLINVIKGDMSLIGPRPLLVQYLPLYSKTQAKRHNIRPGITGWAQVNGRNAISWGKKFELDVWYVNNISFLLDIKILFMTLKKVLISEGVNESENLNSSAFDGSN
ncbi:sugar transferase [Cellulophaga sp. HaHa_2_95]|uniref:sugar transferase n=1 Tax=Cellulophaga sp. HaHa_2_95 TaxID=2745558 RepID=UPI001C4EC4C8|nr:sugar transferase [Cellulophaga sp. HaHa_2_95]QXP55248.1 sugar transferase [Cellulophaga sp. HaHa_2_95]